VCTGRAIPRPGILDAASACEISPDRRGGNRREEHVTISRYAYALTIPSRRARADLVGLSAVRVSTTRATTGARWSRVRTACGWKHDGRDNGQTWCTNSAVVLCCGRRGRVARRSPTQPMSPHSSGRYHTYFGVQRRLAVAGQHLEALTSSSWGWMMCDALRQACGTDSTHITRHGAPRSRRCVGGAVSGFAGRRTGSVRGGGHNHKYGLRITGITRHRCLQPAERLSRDCAGRKTGASVSSIGGENI